MDIGRSYRPLFACILLAVFAVGLGFIFIGRNNTVVRAPGTIYPIRYTELTSSIGLGRVVEVFKAMGDQVNAGEVILTLDAEDEKLKLEVIQKQIAGLKEIIKEHARVLERDLALKKAAVELAKAQEKEAIAAIQVQRDLQTSAGIGELKFGTEPTELEIKVADQKVELAKKTEEEAKLIYDNFKDMEKKNIGVVFDTQKALLAYEKTKSQTVEAKNELALLKAQIPFRLQEAKSKTAEFNSTIVTAQATAAVKKEELRNAELSTTLIVDEKGKELEAEVGRLQVEEKRLDRVIKDKVLKSPASGLLKEFRVLPGQWISDRAVLGTIYDTSTLIIHAHVQQKDFLKVQPGMDAKITFDALTSEEGPVYATVLSLEALATPPAQDAIQPTAIFQEPIKGAWVPRAMVTLKLVDSPLNAKLHVGFTGAVKILVKPENPMAKYFYKY